MKIQITASELMDRGLWLRACDLLGIKEWAINEGLMSRDQSVELSEDQARELGILPRTES